MKYVKLFEQFEDIHEICKEYNIKKYTVNSDGSIDVDGNVHLSSKGLSKLPLKFGKVSGWFDCYNNQLTTLEGGPKEVGGDFYCHSNKLTTLEGGPKIVRSNFWCNNNKLLTFEGSPDYIYRNFYCVNSPIKIIWDLFSDWEKVELLNDYDLLRVEGGKGVLIWDRLVDFLETIKKPQPTEEQIKEIEKYYEIR